MMFGDETLQSIIEDYKLLLELIKQDIQTAQLKGWDTHNKITTYNKVEETLDFIESTFNFKKRMEG